MNMKKLVALACMALAFIMAGSVLATDNVGTGGTITYTDAGGALVGAPVTGGDVIHTFTSSGTLNIPVPASADVLVVAGGGGGGSSVGGGGGAGGYIYSNSFPVVAGSNYQVTVGTGGAGGAGGYSDANQGANGSNSVFGSLIAYGGGGGGGCDDTSATCIGRPGGSGGGGSFTQAGGAGTNGQGYAGGGNTSWSSPYPGGGGGGAGSVGTNGNATTLGHGGIGKSNNISGVTTWYAGGGGGGTYEGGSVGNGGLGGGGKAWGASIVGSNGVPNTGGGGGGMGGNHPATQAGSGGSGIVIVRYPYDPGTFSIGLTSPANNQIFNSTASVSATANVFLATPPCTVKFYLDGNLVSTTIDAPATVTVDLGVLANGPHTVEATATDSTSTTVSSGIRPFTVDGIHPTLAPTGIVDNQSGGLVTTPALVTYTVTFSKDMDASTVSAASFGNAGTAAVTIGTVTETTSTSGVFTVPVTATGAGPLQLKVNAGAVLNDAVGNALDTTSAILDDTTITVVDPPGNTGSGGTITYTDSNGANPRPTTPYDPGYVVHTFTSSDTLNIPVPASADVLVVAGGGAGGGGPGAGWGAGGGAGGLIYSTAFSIAANSNYTVTVGGGGATSSLLVGNGANSVFGSLTALGGGRGSDRGAGYPGGSGGGAWEGYVVGASGLQPGSASGGYGNNGGAPYGGGGGAGAAGASFLGGIGREYSISGVAAYYAGGGGGPGDSTVVPGGGGRRGATSGVANTGGGGAGGHESLGVVPGSGGSGIVIVRYPYTPPPPSGTIISFF